MVRTRNWGRYALKERKHMNKKINLADLERENERLRRQLAELDELPGKKGTETVSGRKGVQDIPTNVGNKIRSAPPTRQDDRYYLDLYLLQKERDRLAQEIALIKKRRLRIGIKVADIDKEMAKKQEKALQDMAILSSEPPTSQADGKSVKEKAAGKNQKAPKRYEYKDEEWNKFTLEY